MIYSPKKQPVQKPKNSTRMGIIEVGSRSIRFLVADFDFDRRGYFDALATKSITHKIDMNDLGDSDLDHVLRLVESLSKELDEFICDRTIIYGTALCRALVVKFGPGSLKTIRVLLVEEEAKASWAAAMLCETQRNSPKQFTVIDQGGGSTEIVTGSWDGARIENIAFKSFDFGHNAIREKFEANSKEFVKSMNVLVHAMGEELKIFSKKNAQEKLYMQGDVPTRIAWFRARSNESEPYKPHLVNGVEIKIKEMTNLYNVLLKLYKVDQKQAIRYVDNRAGNEDRFPQVLSNSAFLMVLAAKIGHTDHFNVSGYGTRHGIAFLAVTDLM